MKTFDILYARDSNGDIKFWKVRVRESETIAYIDIKYGKLGYKGTRATTDVDEGKNLGKSNATTPYQQACNEAQSKWTKKKQEGYKTIQELGIRPKMTGFKYGLDEDSVWTERLEHALEATLPKFNTDASGHAKPMKAWPYSKAKIVFPCIAQPKINGVRATIGLEDGSLVPKEVTGLFDNMITTQGKRIVIRSKEGHEYILPHIVKVVERLNIGDLILDGELYVAGQSISNHKKYLPMINTEGIQSKPSRNPEDVSFYCFDLAIANVTQIERDRMRNELFGYTLDIDSAINYRSFYPIVNVPTIRGIKDLVMGEYYKDICIRSEYEGVILRNLNALYKFGSRSKDLAKLKKFHDEEFEILDILEKKSSSNRVNITFVLRNNKYNSEHFESTPEGNNATKLEYLRNKRDHIGKKATVKFYERSGKARVPFHSNVIAIRDYE